jgi:hypothetical protein
LISGKTHVKPRTNTKPLRLARLLAAIAITPACALLTFSAPLAQAQNFGARTIQGIVTENDTHAGGATIFLKNLKTRDIKSYTSTPDGAFRFTQVGMIDDYEVWAERGKKKSAVKTVSSFDSRKQLDLELKLK